jgi:integrase
MAVRKRGNYWYARWRGVDGRQEEKGGFLTKSKAENYANSKRLLANKGKRTKPSETEMTIGEFANAVWVKTLNVRVQTLVDYKRALESHIFKEFGDIPMQDIKRSDLQAWAAKMAKNGLSPKTIQKHLNLMASILKMAKDNDYIQINPFSTWKRGKAHKRFKVNPLTIEQVEKLASNLDPKYQLMVWLGYYTGARPSEMLAITWDRIDWATKEITIDRQLSRNTNTTFEKEGLKTKASTRKISMTQELEGLIRDHVDKYGLGPDGLLLKNRLGGVLRYPDAASLFRNAARAIGMREGEGLHQLRHSCVSTLIAMGINIKAIQEWVGHTSIVETMDIYGHLFVDSRSQVKAAWDAHNETGKRNAHLSVVSVVNVP